MAVEELSTGPVSFLPRKSTAFKPAFRPPVLSSVLCLIQFLCTLSLERPGSKNGVGLPVLFEPLDEDEGGD
jgi:hypothetical protein